VIKDAINKILELASPSLVELDKRTYVNQSISPMTEPMPAPMQIHTLTGLVDYIAAHKNMDMLCDLDGEAPFFHVLSHKEVELRSGLVGAFCQRKTFLYATPPENRGYPFGTWLDPESFGTWLDPESFIIALQAMFVPDETTAGLLTLVSSIKEEAVKTSGDDGISQTVTARAGVALVTEVKVPNPVTLRPYRTFLEVDQPAISCVFRLRQGPMLSLHEADGGLWRLEAIQSIKAFLVQAMVDLGQDIPVIA
jgi:hypothetical protein